MGKWCLHASLFLGNKDMSFEMRFDLGTLDSGERSLPFGLLVSVSHPSQWADLFAPCNPTQGSTQTLPVILWYSPCDPPVFPPKWVESQGNKILILSTQVKQGKEHRILIILCNPTLKLHWKYLCFHCSVSTEMGRITEGGGNFLILPVSFVAHWDGREIQKTLKLYCTLQSETTVF